MSLRSPDGGLNERDAAGNPLEQDFAPDRTRPKIEPCQAPVPRPAHGRARAGRPAPGYRAAGEPMRVSLAKSARQNGEPP